MEVAESADAGDEHLATSAEVGGGHAAGYQRRGAQAAQNRRHPLVPRELAVVAERLGGLHEPGQALLEPGQAADPVGVLGVGIEESGQGAARALHRFGGEAQDVDGPAGEGQAPLTARHHRDPQPAAGQADPGGQTGRPGPDH